MCVFSNCFSSWLGEAYYRWIGTARWELIVDFQNGTPLATVPSRDLRMKVGMTSELNKPSAPCNSAGSAVLNGEGRSLSDVAQSHAINIF